MSCYRIVVKIKGNPVWKILGLAGAAGVAATGAIVVRNNRARAAYTPEQIREHLHERFASLPDPEPMVELRRIDGIRGAIRRGIERIRFAVNRGTRQQSSRRSVRAAITSALPLRRHSQSNESRTAEEISAPLTKASSDGISS